MNEQNIIPTQAEDKIELIALVKVLWEGRRTVIKITVIFMVVGLFLAIFSEKEFKASCTIVPQTAEGGSKLGGSLGGLAAMAGINLGSMGGGATISPILYPKIVNSIPFQKELMKTPLSIEGYPDKVSFESYYRDIYRPSLFGYVKKYTINLPSVIMMAFRGESTISHHDLIGDQLLRINMFEKRLIDRLNNQLSLEVNDKDGFISLSARMPEAKAAAQLARRAQVLLQNAIKDFKIQKANDHLKFVEKRFFEKQKETQLAQKKLASFRDKNKNVTTAMFQVDLERLVADYNLVNGVYSELAKQLEKQKIQVKEDTPIFTVIDPVSIPIEKSKPRRAVILLIWTFLGVMVGIGIVIGRIFLNGVKQQLRDVDALAN